MPGRYGRIFAFAERFEFLNRNKQRANSYFWRTYQQKEINLVEESGGTQNAIAFEWNPAARSKKPREFPDAYPGASFRVIHRENFRPFLMG